MSLKSGQGKSLKGIRTTSMSNLSTANSIASTLSSGTLSNVIISGGMLDNVTIGAIQPKDAIFTSVVIGQQTPLGVTPGPFYCYGTNPNTYVQWDPITSTFSINGGNLVVSGGSTLGNIQIIDNNIIAVNRGGNINLIPNSPTESIFIEGNLQQSASGVVLFDHATQFSVTSSGTSNLVSQTNVNIGTNTGNINICTDQTVFSSVVVSIVYIYNNGNNFAAITLATTLNLTLANTISLTNTNTIPSIDGIYSISNVNNNVITIQVHSHFTNGTFGNLIVQLNGQITLNAGKQINLSQNVPLIFNNNNAISNQYIVSDANNLKVCGNYINLLDPIVTLDQSSVSDSGVCINFVNNQTLQHQNGFFGLINNNLQYLTWIPNATITTQSTDVKFVTGVPGIMQLSGLVTNQIIGTPNIALNAPTGYITFNCLGFNIPSALIGTGGGITGSGTNLNISSNGSINLIPTTNITIPPNTPLTFIGAGSITGSVNGTLTFQSRTANPLTFIGNMYLPMPWVFYFGSNNLTTIYGDANNINITSGSNVFLEPAGAVVIHDNILLQIGDTLATGCYGVQGKLYLESASSMIINSTGNLTVNASTISVNSAMTTFPLQSEIAFGGTSFISTLVKTAFTLQTSLNMNLVSSSVINLSAPSVNVPQTIPLKFGNYSTVSENVDSTLHITNTSGGVIISNSLIVNGMFTVNGPSTQVVSTVTVIQDPIITLGATTSTSSDIRDRGIQFYYGTGLHGFMGFSQLENYFVLISNGVDLNDVFTPNVYGDLKLNTLFAANLETSTIVGDPDLSLVATNIALNATGQINIPTNINVYYGSDNFNYITGTNNGLIIQSPNVSITGGNVSIGNTYLTLVDVNNFSIKNVQNIHLDAIVFVESSIFFGTNLVGILTDQNNNLKFVAPNNLIFTTSVIFNTTSTMGNSVMSWDLDYPGGQILWKSILSNSLLNVELIGNITGATWLGNIIGLKYGGTGYPGTWIPQSIVWVDVTGNYLNQDPENFVYNSTTGSLGIRTNNPIDAITIGSGNINLLGDASTLIFNNLSISSFVLGKINQNFGINGTNTNTITNNSYFIVNPFGQIGINMSSSFMSSLTGSGSSGTNITGFGSGIQSILYVNGNVSFANPLNQLQWTSTEYITSTGTGSLVLASANSINFNSTVNFALPCSFLETDTRIYGKLGGILEITSDNKIELNAPHIVIPNRLCWHHDSVSDACLIYSTKLPTDDLLFSNTIGNIILQPLASVIIPNGSFVMGTALNVFAIGNDINICSLGNILLTPTENVVVPLNTNFTFGSVDITSMSQSSTEFSIISNTGINIVCPSITIPSGSNLIFGNQNFQIKSLDDTLYIYSPDLVKIVSNNVQITGNLVVSQKTTFTIDSETHFASGVIVLGGTQSLAIQNIVNWINSQTLVSVNQVHNLQIGNTITLVDTIPFIDGIYTIIDVPSLISIVINVTFPGLPIGATVQGTLESALTSDPGHDCGVEVNWNSGIGINNAKTAFFGFNRSTQRFIFIPQATNVNNVFSGSFGDMQINTLYATNISANYLISSLSAGNNLVSGTNFVLTGGAIDNMNVGNLVPRQGTFTNLIITTSLSISNTNLVPNFNANYLNGFQSSDFILRNGSTGLLSNWNAGNYRITTNGITDTTLTPGGVIFAGSTFDLTTNSTFIYNNNTLQVPQIGACTFVGTVNFNSNIVSNASIINSTINSSNITLNAGYTLNLIDGNVLFATGQIPGYVVSGGTSNINITGSSGTVINGMYTTDYSQANSILKCDTINQPTLLNVPENSFIGRMSGGVISAISVTDMALLFGSYSELVANSILKADITGISEPLYLPESTIVGRLPGGIISAITIPELQTLLNVSPGSGSGGSVSEQSLCDNGALLRVGHLFPGNGDYTGGTMTGLMFGSYERLTVVSGQNVVLNKNVETSYISVHYSKVAGPVANCVLPNGLADCHKKNIIVSCLAENSILKITCNFIAPDTPDPAALVFYTKGQSAALMWDAVLQKYVILGTGCVVVTPAELRDPNWIANVLGM